MRCPRCGHQNSEEFLASATPQRPPICAGCGIALENASASASGSADESNAGAAGAAGSAAGASGVDTANGAGANGVNDAGAEPATANVSSGGTAAGGTAGAAGAAGGAGAAAGGGTAGGGRPRSVAGMPVWQRPKEAAPTEAPPWSGAANAAPWQTPPEFGVPGRPRASERDRDPEPGQDAKHEPVGRSARPGGGAAGGDQGVGGGGVGGGVGGRAGSAGSAPLGRSTLGSAGQIGGMGGVGAPGDLAGRQPGGVGSGVPSRFGPRGLVRALGALLVVDALVLLAYAGFALTARRSTFTGLESDPNTPTAADLAHSDTLNLAFFLVSGLLTVLVGAALAWVIVRSRRSGPSGFTTSWYALSALGAVGVLGTLVMHRSESPGTIAAGYVVLGIAAVLLAVAAGWAARILFAAPASAPPGQSS